MKNLLYLFLIILISCQSEVQENSLNVLSENKEERTKSSYYVIWIKHCSQGVIFSESEIVSSENKDAREWFKETVRKSYCEDSFYREVLFKDAQEAHKYLKKIEQFMFVSKDSSTHKVLEGIEDMKYNSDSLQNDYINKNYKQI